MPYHVILQCMPYHVILQCMLHNVQIIIQASYIPTFSLSFKTTTLIAINSTCICIHTLTCVHEYSACHSACGEPADMDPQGLYTWWIPHVWHHCSLPETSSLFPPSPRTMYMYMCMNAFFNLVSSYYEMLFVYTISFQKYTPFEQKPSPV